MKMIKKYPEIRCRDSQGAGYYHAKRSGGRLHDGVDFISTLQEASYIFRAGSDVLALAEGVVTKIGYPYADHLEYRYVEIEDSRGFKARYFYVLPSVELGYSIEFGDKIGVCQTLQPIYGGIQDHYHFEVIKYQGGQKVFFDPMKYLAGDL